MFVVRRFKKRRKLANSIEDCYLAVCLIILVSDVLADTTPSSAGINMEPHAIVKHADSARNLTVEPLVSHSTKELQLNVSWLPPEGDALPSSYSIEVISKNSTKYCVSKPCDDHIDASLSWKLVPPNIAVIDGSECSIRPGCTYFVSLKSHPFSGKNRLKATVAIPECVKNVCVCETPSILPRPIVDAVVKNNTVNITWHVTKVPDNVELSHYRIKFGAQTVITPHSSPWFGHDQLYEIPWNGKDVQWKEINVTDHKNHTYHAWIHLVDVRGCLGPAGNRTFTFKQDAEVKTVEELKAINIIIIVFGVLSTISLIIVVLVRWKAPNKTPCCVKLLLASARGEQNLRRQPVWPRINTENNGQFAMAPNVLRYEERCPLYVEKEIEEARLRGEVDSWEISPNRVKLGPLIGEGAFGRVFIARLETPGEPVVAVKKLKDSAVADEVKEFLSEIAMLKLVGNHRHVVALVGCCTMRQPYCAILEYAERGELLAHLRKLRELYKKLSDSPRSSLTSSLAQNLRKTGARPSLADTEYTLLESESGCPGKYVPNMTCSITDESIAKRSFPMMSGYMASELTGTSLDSEAFGGSSLLLSEDRFQTVHSPELVLDPRELHNYALQIAKGMEHLEKIGITHRDLAARNILIDGEGMLKISDLGLSRPGIYVNKNRNKVPLRWLAIEAIRTSYYSSKSDVWSYAVVLWEIGTLGGHPYPTLSDHQIVSYLLEGKRLDKPPIVSLELYSTMIRCWTEKPEQRPRFSELVALLETKNKGYIDITSIHNSLNFPPTEEMLDAEKQNEFAEESRNLIDSKIV